MNEELNFSDYLMICASTGNQTINFMPAIQFGIKEAITFSTKYTENNGFTKRLIDVMKKRGIVANSYLIDDMDEKAPLSLLSKLLEISKGHEKIVWNISGGQKIPAIAFNTAFQRRIDVGYKDDILLYVEANPPKTWYYNNFYEAKSINTCTNITLKEILELYGYDIDNDNGNHKMSQLYPNPTEDTIENLTIGRKALEHYKTDEVFREAFFSHMKPSIQKIHNRADIVNLIKDELNARKPYLNEIKVTMTGYKEFESTINDIFSKLNAVNSKKEIEDLIKPLKIIKKPAELYDNYWSQIKNAIIEGVINKIEFDEVRLIKADIGKSQIEQLIAKVKDIGGLIQNYSSGVLLKKHIPIFSKFKSNGILFEWMVAAAILNEIENNERIKNSISEVYHSVKTKKIGSERADAEHDIVIVTKFGTLIIIELKTYEFSGNLAQAQEGLVYKKSGPYGSAMIIGPLLAEMVKVNNKGQRETPHYIENEIKTQEDTAKQNGVEYYYLDQISIMLSKKLFVGSR